MKIIAFAIIFAMACIVYVNRIEIIPLNDINRTVIKHNKLTDEIDVCFVESYDGGRSSKIAQLQCSNRTINSRGPQERPKNYGAGLK